MASRHAPDPALDALSRTLLWYGTAAGAVLTAPSDADAQVVAVDLDPDVVVIEGVFPLDFDLDADPELLVKEFVTFPAPDARTGLTLEGDDLEGFLGRRQVYYPFPGYCYSSYVSWRPLVAGVEVSRSNPRMNTGRHPVCIEAGFIYQDLSYRTGPGADYDLWDDRPRAFIGLAFRPEGANDLRFGWVDVTVPPDKSSVTVHRYAYNATPEAPIVTGAAGTAAPVYTLDGVVNQTTFPPEGGTLRFTATVTNTTGEPVPLDLWLVARRGGAVVAVRRLGSGTLPPGATVTRTVETEVPASVPAGTYDVRYHLGRFPAVLDSEAFTITKTGAEGAPSGDDGHFGVEPIPGDLLADAAASGATARSTGTLALGAPSPNPSAGMAVIPLSVAEPQRVRVTVHDALGREVAVLHDGPLAPGVAHRLAFDGAGLARGVYVVRAVGETFSDARAVTLTR